MISLHPPHLTLPARLRLFPLKPLDAGETHTPGLSISPAVPAVERSRPPAISYIRKSDAELFSQKTKSFRVTIF
jgi:hypothetical protein